MLRERSHRSDREPLGYVSAGLVGTGLLGGTSAIMTHHLLNAPINARIAAREDAQRRLLNLAREEANTLNAMADIDAKLPLYANRAAEMQAELASVHPDSFRANYARKELKRILDADYKSNEKLLKLTDDMDSILGTQARTLAEQSAVNSKHTSWLLKSFPTLDKGPEHARKVLRRAGWIGAGLGAGLGLTGYHLATRER